MLFLELLQNERILGFHDAHGLLPIGRAQDENQLLNFKLVDVSLHYFFHFFE